MVETETKEGTTVIEETNESHFTMPREHQIVETTTKTDDMVEELTKE